MKHKVFNIVGIILAPLLIVHFSIYILAYLAGKAVKVITSALSNVFD